jgi:hypothetical protein
VDEDKNERFILTLDDQSREDWRAFQNQIESELKPNGRLRPISGWGGKISGFALRLAGLIHVMKGNGVDSLIDHETMGNALALATNLKEHALSAFGLMSVDKDTEKAHVVLEWIKANGEHSFLKSDCHKALHGQFKDVKELEEALQILKERHVVSSSESLNSGGKGRPSIIYNVNPALFSDVN